MVSDYYVYVFTTIINTNYSTSVYLSGLWSLCVCVIGAVISVDDRGKARRSILVVSDHYVYVL